MEAILFLIIIGVVVAGGFLIAFIWGKYATGSMTMIIRLR